MINSQWLIIFLVVISAALIFLKNIFPNQFARFLSSPFSIKTFQSYLYELNGRPNLFLVILIGISYSLVSVFLFQVKEFIGISFVLGKNYRLIFYLFFGLIVLFLLKNILLRILQIIFKLSEQINAHVIIQYIFNSLSGIVLLPFLLMLGYLDSSLVTPSLFVVVGLLIILFLFRQIFITYILFRSGFSVFSILLYLCALEIAPLLLLLHTVKLLVN